MPDTIIAFTVDYSIPVTELIRAGSYYNSVENHQQIPVTGTGKINIKVQEVVVGIGVTMVELLQDWRLVDPITLLTYIFKYRQEKSKKPSLITLWADEAGEDPWSLFVREPARYRELFVERTKLLHSFDEYDMECHALVLCD